MTAPDHTGDFASGVGDVAGMPGVAPVSHWHDDYMAAPNAAGPDLGAFNSGLGDLGLGGAAAPYND